MLDRSEKLLLDLIQCGGDEVQVLQLLLRIYEKERDWRKAIQISKRLQSKKHQKRSTALSGRSSIR